MPCSLKEFRKFMTAQLDLRVEARNLDRFAQNFEGWKSVRFPRPLIQFCHEHVLVETYEDGKSVKEVS